MNTFAKALDDLNEIDLRNRPISHKEKNYVMLKKLEAIGLITFEEEITSAVIEGHIVSIDVMIKALEGIGYKVTRK